MSKEPIEITGPVGGHLELDGKEVDFLEVEWYETAKSRMRKRTVDGVEILLERLDRSALQHGDVLHISDRKVLKVRILPCVCIVLRPATLPDVGRACFDIGNKHIPIFLTGQHEICVAYDANLYEMLISAGHKPVIEDRVLQPSQVIKAYGNTSSA